MAKVDCRITIAGINGGTQISLKQLQKMGAKTRAAKAKRAKQGKSKVHNWA